MLLIPVSLCDGREYKLHAYVNILYRLHQSITLAHLEVEEIHNHIWKHMHTLFTCISAWQENKWCKLKLYWLWVCYCLQQKYPGGCSSLGLWLWCWCSTKAPIITENILKVIAALIQCLQSLCVHKVFSPVVNIKNKVKSKCHKYSWGELARSQRAHPKSSTL